ncbi:hypothetical protein EV424DRAFT_1343560 [Suillus variegatus]|nr:hypothetical protein EV424DRAFT_1343560 [Suillus variegatus]
MPALNLETLSLVLTPRSFVCKFNSVRQHHTFFLCCCRVLPMRIRCLKNDTVTWDRVKTAQYRVETPQADEEAEPPFAHAAGVELDASDVAVDAVLQHIALGELSIPDGYSADGLGNLLADNESESYEQAPDDTEPQFAAVTTDSSKEVDVEGRGKRRRVANTQYKDFWQH